MVSLPYLLLWYIMKAPIILSSFQLLYFFSIPYYLIVNHCELGEANL